MIITIGKVALFKTEGAEHYHENASKPKADSSDVALINTLMSSNVKNPKIVKRTLDAKGKELTLNQIRRVQQSAKTADEADDFGALQNIIQRDSKVPENEITPYFSASMLNPQGEKFRFFLTSKKLMENYKYFEHLQTDATYKINYQGYPLLVVGSEDKNNKFHLFGLALCTSETAEDYGWVFQALEADKPLKAVMGDAADAITKAIQEFFGESVRRVVCYFHVKKNLKEKAKASITFSSRAY